MRLYSLGLSAYAARCRAAIRAKALPIEIVSPPGGLRSETFARLTPLRRVPALELDDGLILVESDVICEYLEELFPATPLLPANPLGRARVRQVIRIVDNYLAPQLGRLLGAQNGIDARTLGREEIAPDLASYRQGLGYLEHALGEDGFALGDALTLADCAALPMLFIAFAALRLLDEPPFVEGSRTDRYVRAGSKVAVVREACREQADDVPPHMRAAAETFFDVYGA